MAEAKIRIDQAANSIPNGVAGVSRDDIILGQPVVVRIGNKNGVRTKRWVLEPPYGSSVLLSSTDSEAPSFTPDVYGTYRVKLSVNGSGEGEVDERTVIVRDPAGHRYPATKEGAESNYATGPGEFNKEGWSPDLRRMLQSYDNRGMAPLEVTVAPGDNQEVVVTLPGNMDEGVLQYFYILSTDSTDTSIRLSADGVEFLRIINIDATSGYRYLQNVSLMTGQNLPDHQFSLTVFNDDAMSSDYEIYLRVKAT